MLMSHPKSRSCNIFQYTTHVLVQIPPRETRSDTNKTDMHRNHIKSILYKHVSSILNLCMIRWDEIHAKWTYDPK